MADDALVATIEVNGMIYSTWESVHVETQIDSFPVFEFIASEGSYGPNYENLKIYPGDKVRILLDGLLAVTGLVAIRKVAYDEKSHIVSITGTGMGGMTTNASVPHKQGTYDGYSFQQTGNAILKDINLTMSIKNDNGSGSMPFDRNIIHYTEKIHETLVRLGRQRNLFISEDENGTIVANRFDAAGTDAGTLTEGRDIISASVVEDNGYMTNTTAVISQTGGSDSSWPSRDQSASVAQAGVSTANQFDYLLSEHPLPKEQLKDRAQHENVLKTLASVEIEVVVLGWKNSEGQLWKPLDNPTITVASPMLFPDAPYSYAGQLYKVVFQQNAGGSTSILNLRKPIGSTGAIASGGADGAGGGDAGGDPQNKENDAKPQTDPPDDQPAQAPAGQTSSTDGQADGFGSTSAVQQQQTPFQTDAQTDMQNDAPDTASKQDFPKNADDGSHFDPNSASTTYQPDNSETISGP